MPEKKVLIVVGMAGSGKSTFVQRIAASLHSNDSKPYVINLDPAVGETPYAANIDIQKTISYSAIQSEYKLGPNGAILTSLNLFATKFDQVMNLIDKRNEEFIIIDTPGQIEAFTWSSSGKIITECLGNSYPTILVYVIDSVRSTNSETFICNMLYALSMYYRSELPILVVYNKIDVQSPQPMIDWMKDGEKYQESLDGKEYMSSLSGSMGRVLEEMYGIMKISAVSSVTGQGVDDFFRKVEESVQDYKIEQRDKLDRKTREVSAKKEADISPSNFGFSVKKLTTTVGADRGFPVQLYHEIHGSGKHKILFITVFVFLFKGWAGSCENWKFQTEFFGKHGDFEVCIYENRGSGFSSAPPKNYTMQDMAQDAQDLIKQLGWNNIHIVGGMIAQELALLMPSKIQSLTLASTCAGRSLPPTRHIPWIMTALTKIALGISQAKEKMPFFLYSQRWLNSPAPLHSGYKSNLEYMLKFHGCRIDDRPPQSISAAIKQLSGIIRHHVSKPRLNSLKNQLLKLSVPSMVIHGTEDVLVHVRSAFSLAKSLGARLVVFEGRGHALNHEDIETFNRLLLRHFYTAILGNNKIREAEIKAGWDKVLGKAKAVVGKVKGSLSSFYSYFEGFVWGSKRFEKENIEWVPEPKSTAGTNSSKSLKYYFT